MIFFRKLFRILHIICIFAFGMAQLVVVRPRSRPERAAWLTQFCRKLLRAGHMTYSTIGPVPMQGAVITNHLNFTDILMHSATRPCVFVSKAELRRTPVLGWVSMMAGTLYVERGAGGSAAKAAEGMAKGFRDGLPVVFFPEGTTGVGDEPAMPFRSGLLAQALEAGVDITAGFIRYELPPEDLARGLTTKKVVHWGDVGLVEHISDFVGTTSVHGTIRFAEAPITFTPGALANRKIAAKEARDAVRALAAAPQTSPVIDAVTEP